MKPTKKDRKKFDLDLKYGSIREDRIAEMLTNKKIEVKSERDIWQNTGNICIESVVLFALIFFWTPPHFWSLALYRAGDYEKAGVPMLPVVAGKRETKRQIIIYTMVLLPLAVAPAVLGVTGWLYGIFSLILGLLFLAAAVSVWVDKTERASRRMFTFSIFYLFLLFTLMIVDRSTVFSA